MIGGAHRLAVEDRRARRGLAADTLTVRHHQRMMDPVPDALPLPAAEIIVDRLPRRQIVRQQPPAATGAQEVEDRVDELPRRRLARTASRLGLRDHRLDQRPLTIAQIGVIGRRFGGFFLGIGSDSRRSDPTPDESRQTRQGNPSQTRSKTRSCGY